MATLPHSRAHGGLFGNPRRSLEPDGHFTVQCTSSSPSSVTLASDSVLEVAVIQGVALLSHVRVNAPKIGLLALQCTAYSVVTQSHTSWSTQVHFTVEAGDPVRLVSVVDADAFRVVC